MTYSKLDTMIKTMLSNPEKMDNRRIRDASGELPSRNKDNPNSWYMKLIKSTFPEEEEAYGTNCSAIGMCMRHLFSRYITTMKQLKDIAPLIKRLGVFIAASEAQYFFDVRVALKKGKKSGAFELLADKLFKQSKDEKEEEQRLNPGNLEARLQKPLFMPLVETLAVMQANADTDDMGKLGWILEGAVGTRSIDLMNPEVATITLNPDNKEELLIKGHSKVRTEALWEKVKNTVAVVRPVALTAQQVVDGLERYRRHTAVDIAFINKSNADALSKLNGLARLQFVNEKLSAIWNNKLSEAAKLLFPVVAKEAAEQKRPFASHVARAFHANASYQLYGNGELENTYFKRALQHSNYGSIVNYQQLRVVAPGAASETADLTNLKTDMHVLQEKVSELIEICGKEAKEEKEGKEGEEEVVNQKKRKKPDVPKHLPKGPQFVTLKDKYGNDVRFQKLPRVIGLSEELALERVQKAEAMLLDHDILISARNVKALGIGQRSVNCLRIKVVPSESECEATDYSKEREAKAKRN